MKQQDNIRYGNGLNLTVKDVYASLRHGQVFSEKIWVIVSILAFCAAGVEIIGSVSVGIYSAVTGDTEGVEICICLFAAGIVILLAGLLLYLLPLHNKKKAALWLEDAVLLEAKCVSLGLNTIYRLGMAFRAAAIEVRF